MGAADGRPVGYVEYVRDVRFDGRSERHLALHVVGSVDHRLSLGLVAIRCERIPSRAHQPDGGLVPLTLSIPDSGLVVDGYV